MVGGGHHFDSGINRGSDDCIGPVFTALCIPPMGDLDGCGRAAPALAVVYLYPGTGVDPPHATLKWGGSC